MTIPEKVKQEILEEEQVFLAKIKESIAKDPQPISTLKQKLTEQFTQLLDRYAQASPTESFKTTNAKKINDLLNTLNEYINKVSELATDTEINGDTVIQLYMDLLLNNLLDSRRLATAAALTSYIYNNSTGNSKQAQAYAATSLYSITQYLLDKNEWLKHAHLTQLKQKTLETCNTALKELTLTVTKGVQHYRKKGGDKEIHKETLLGKKYALFSALLDEISKVNAKPEEKMRCVLAILNKPENIRFLQTHRGDENCNKLKEWIWKIGRAFYKLSRWFKSGRKTPLTAPLPPKSLELRAQAKEAADNLQNAHSNYAAASKAVLDIEQKTANQDTPRNCNFRDAATRVANAAWQAGGAAIGFLSSPMLQHSFWTSTNRQEQSASTEPKPRRVPQC